VIADAARTMPHTLRSLELTDELTVLVGFDQDLTAEATRTSNRIRGLLTQFHPSLERVLGPRLDHQAGRRRYCMPEVCGNRLNVASHRALRQTGLPEDGT
jgi:hypothetical protein